MRSPGLSAASSLVASLDVSEATKQLRKEKTTIVQCARGALYYLRDIKDSEAVCEPLDGGDESTHTLASLWQVTGYDSDEDGLARDPRVTNIKRQRTSAGSSCSALILQPSSALTAAIDKEPTAAERMLRKAFPLVSPHGTAHLEKALRELEKYELVCQGDDYADPECLATNSEALQYARANAVVKGLTWSISASLASRGRGRTLERLKAEPFLGESNARKVLDIVETGTCGRTLSRFQRGEAPLDSSGSRRVHAHRSEHGATRRMTGAPAKLELASVLCLSAIRAGELVDDTRDPIRSIAELRARPDRLASLGGGVRLQHSLAVHEDLQEPVPADDAIAMLRTVQEAVRALSIPHANGWHAEFVGGGRTRGFAGHDVDLLLSHAEEMASFLDGNGQPVFVINLLLEELVRRGRVLPKTEAYHNKKTARYRHETPRPYLSDLHMANETSKGYENLHHDHHDKFFGIWRSARTSKLHRIDIVVCSHPEELPFARLGWTGTRTLNRMMRLRAIELGLYLGAHSITARGSQTPGSTTTQVVVEARPGRTPVTVTLQKLEPLPFEYVRSEEAILRVLACGTDDFINLVEPTNRNA